MKKRAPDEMEDFPEINEITPIEDENAEQIQSNNRGESKKEKPMQKQEEKMPCANCGQEMQLIAKGPRGRRLWGCYNCSENPKEPRLYFQPTDIYALRPLEQKPLIDMSFKHQSSPD